jgi:hypothetical protein
VIPFARDEKRQLSDVVKIILAMTLT